MNTENMAMSVSREGDGSMWPLYSVRAFTLTGEETSSPLTAHSLVQGPLKGSSAHTH